MRLYLPLADKYPQEEILVYYQRAIQAHFGPKGYVKWIENQALAIGG
jgi:hypothetical protein